MACERNIFRLEVSYIFIEIFDKIFQGFTCANKLTDTHPLKVLLYFKFILVFSNERKLSNRILNFNLNLFSPNAFDVQKQRFQKLFECFRHSIITFLQFNVFVKGTRFVIVIRKSDKLLIT